MGATSHSSSSLACESVPLTIAAMRPTHLPDSMDMNVWPCSTLRPDLGTSTYTISLDIFWANTVTP